MHTITVKLSMINNWTNKNIGVNKYLITHEKNKN